MELTDDCDVFAHGVVAKVVDLSSAQSVEEASDSIVETQPLVDSTDFAFSVDVDLASHMVVPHESGGKPRDNIVVVDPSIVSDLEKGRVLSISDAWSSEGKDRLGVGWNGGEFAANGADGGHSAPQGVSTEPNWTLVFSESVFDIGPKQLHVAIETAVDSADIASDGPSFGIGGYIL